MMKRRLFVKGQLRNSRGFTLIEIIAALIILAIVSAVVISRGASSADANLKSAAEVLKGHIRYAQMRAMNMKSATSGCNASFGIGTAGNSYFMFSDCITSNKVVLPGADGNIISTSGMTLTSTEANITFDDWGRPCSDLNGLTLSPADINLTLGTEPITITKNTGYVP